MKKEVSRNNIKTAVILIIALLLGITINIFGNKIINKICNNIEIEKINTDWQYLRGKNLKENINLPIVLQDDNPHAKVIIEKIISTKGYSEPALLLRSELQSIDIYVDGKCIDKVRKSSKQAFGKEKESDWIFIDLPYNQENIYIKLVFSSEYFNYNGKINGILLGDKSDEIIYILVSGLLKILAAIILFSISMVLLSIYFGSKKFININSKKVLYLSLLNLLTAFWALLSSNILDIVITDAVPRGELKLLSLFFIPVVFIQFLKENYSELRIKILNIMLALLLTYILTSTLLHIFNVMHYMETICIFHGLCAVIFIICMAICIKDNKKINKYGFETVAVIALLLLVGFFDMFIYYYLGFYEESRSFESAVIICTIIFSYFSGKKSKEYYNIENLNEENINFKYKDSLTGLLNRIAFDDKMHEINKSLNKYEGYTIFVFNLNNLKKVNLTLSPFQGNEYIINNVKVLLDIFKNYGNLYRVGADEFVLIGNRDMPISKCEEQLSLYVERYLPDEKIDLIGISYGYDTILRNSKNIYEVYNRAEINMIKLKKRLKRSNIR